MHKYSDDQTDFKHINSLFSLSKPAFYEVKWVLSQTAALHTEQHVVSGSIA